MLEIVRGFLFFVGPMAALYFFPSIMNMVLGSPTQFVKNEEEKSALPDAASARSSDAVDDHLDMRQARQGHRERQEPVLDDELELEVEPYVTTPPEIAAAANMAAAEGAVLATPGVTRNMPLPSNVIVFQRRAAPTDTRTVEDTVYTAPQMQVQVPAQQEYNQDNMPSFDPDEFA